MSDKIFEKYPIGIKFPVYCEDTKETCYSYGEYLSSNHWNLFKNRFYKSGLFKRKCSCCGEKYKSYDLHHRIYHRIGKERLSDVIPLCRQCHTEVHETANQMWNYGNSKKKIIRRRALKKVKRMKARQRDPKFKNRNKNITINNNLNNQQRIELKIKDGEQENLKTVEVYTSGSRNHNATITSWAFVVIDNNDSIIFENNGVMVGEITRFHQIGGELKAAAESLKYCKINNLKARLNYNYIGIYKWVADLNGEQSWEPNNKWAKEYRELVLNHKKYLKEMVKVENDFGNKWNEYVSNITKELSKNN